ncbi:hypothetical protein BJX96DRAFT_141990 [Aspergillus floccosus]
MERQSAMARSSRLSGAVLTCTLLEAGAVSPSASGGHRPVHGSEYTNRPDRKRLTGSEGNLTKNESIDGSIRDNKDSRWKDAFPRCLTSASGLLRLRLCASRVFLHFDF